MHQLGLQAHLHGWGRWTPLLHVVQLAQSTNQRDARLRSGQQHGLPAVAAGKQPTGRCSGATRFLGRSQHHGGSIWRVGVYRSRPDQSSILLNELSRFMTVISSERPNTYEVQDNKILEVVGFTDKLLL